jgi:hypothetical protein
MLVYSLSLLPAGRKFCKITQNRPKKESNWQGKLAAVRPPFLDKSGRKAAEKIFYEKDGFLHKIVHFYEQLGDKVS